MAKLMLQSHNLLALDEPTNHMDIKSKDILKQALKAYDGTLVIVSHDRDFLDGLVDKLYEFRDGHVREFLGGVSDFLAKRRLESLQELERVSRDRVPSGDIAPRGCNGRDPAPLGGVWLARRAEDASASSASVKLLPWPRRTFPGTTETSTDGLTGQRRTTATTAAAARSAPPAYHHPAATRRLAGTIPPRTASHSPAGSASV